MAKKKLQHFAEMDTFQHVFQPRWEVLKTEGFELKGKWRSHFFKNENPIVLELGCGKGEYTVGLSKMNPGKNYIGVDIKGARMWRGAKTVSEEGIPNVAFLRTQIEMISYFFDENEVDEIWLTFPDPQIKKLRKRLSSARFLASYQKFMKPAGIMHLKTDSELMFGFTRDLVRLNQLNVLMDTADLYAEHANDPLFAIKTFYETTYLSRGLKIHYLKFELPKDKVLVDPEENKERQQKEIEERKRTGTNKVLRLQHE